MVDYLEYHRSIAKELLVIKNRIGNLTGHRQIIGEYKEAILRKVLRTHIPSSCHIEKGFVCFKEGASTQVDILITAANKPRLFKDGDLVLVTPDAVEAVIEVKTRQGASELKETLEKLAINVERVRKHGNPDCLAGLFVYDPANAICHEQLLDGLHLATDGTPERAINWIALGPNDFVRYWLDGNDVASPCHEQVWHSYDLVELAQAYFISNVIWDLSRNNSLEQQFAWFPIDGGKEQFRRLYLPLNGNHPLQF